jgi:hypothetical protein
MVSLVTVVNVLRGRLFDRRTCKPEVDIVFGEAYLRRILRAYAAYDADMPPPIMYRGPIDL